METFTTKLGTAKGRSRSRIWIEGRRLLEAGFTAKNTYFIKVWDTASGTLILTRAEADHDPKPSKVSGKADKPIIDITGAKVCEFFTGFDKVNVIYAEGTIIIKGAE